MNKLSPDFLYEFFRLIFLKKEIYDICQQHVKYEYIPNELQPLKKILKSILNNHSESLPSFGVVSQQYIDDVEVQECIKTIKDTQIVDKEQIIDQLESYIKNQRFKLLNEQIYNLYTSKDDRKQEAMDLQAKEAPEIVNFSLKKSNGGFIQIFSDFKSQIKERQISHERGEDKTEKVPFGIDILDDKTDGGIDSGDIAMWIMRSGVGKSTTLRWTGMYCCKLGYKVLHIQLEGNRQEVYDKYAQMWTKARYSDIKVGNFTPQEMEKLEAYIKSKQNANKDLSIYAFEKFGEASMTDVRDLIIDYIKVYGYNPDLVIIDSLDLLKTGKNKKIDNDPNWKKEKMKGVAQLMKDVCTEFYPMRILTATQSGDFAEWNNPDKYLTRSNTEGDRTLVQPFSYVFTFNATMEEEKANSGRIYIDKFRNYKLKDRIFKIKTDYDKGNFYDRKKTLEMYEKSSNL